MRGWALVGAAIYLAVRVVLVAQSYVDQQRGQLLGQMPDGSGVIVFDKRTGTVFTAPFPFTFQNEDQPEDQGF